MDKPFSNNLSPPVTLKMGSRSQKSNQFFYMSQQYRCASLVKIYSFLQEMPSCDLENGVKVTKIKSAFFPLLMIYLCKFG